VVAAKVRIVSACAVTADLDKTTSRKAKTLQRTLNLVASRTSHPAEFRQALLRELAGDPEWQADVADFEL
jgi:hypothetical protein